MAKRTNAVIVGGGVSKFGVREAYILDLFQEATKSCSDDIPGLKPTDTDVSSSVPQWRGHSSAGHQDRVV